LVFGGHELKIVGSIPASGTFSFRRKIMAESNVLYHIAQILYIISCLSIWNMLFLWYKSKNNGLLFTIAAQIIAYILMGINVFDRTFSATDVFVVSTVAILGLFLNSAMLVANLYCNRVKPMVVNAIMLLVNIGLFLVFIVNAFLLGIS
jgi:hypothetical protein